MLSIRDLNQLAGEGHMKIVAERGVAKFQPPEAVRCVYDTFIHSPHPH
jgi:hypothetical protein